MKVNLQDEHGNPLAKEIQEMRLKSRGIFDDYVYDEGTGFYVLDITYEGE